MRRSWLVLSTTLWTPSVSIADEPVIAAATNFEAAIPRFASRATTRVRVLVVSALISPRPVLSRAVRPSPRYRHARAARHREGDRREQRRGRRSGRARSLRRLYC